MILKISWGITRRRSVYAVSRASFPRSRIDDEPTRTSGGRVARGVKSKHPNARTRCHAGGPASARHPATASSRPPHPRKLSVPKVARLGHPVGFRRRCAAAAPNQFGFGGASALPAEALPGLWRGGWLRRARLKPAGAGALPRLPNPAWPGKVRCATPQPVWPAGQALRRLVQFGRPGGGGCGGLTSLASAEHDRCGGCSASLRPGDRAAAHAYPTRTWTGDHAGWR
jgi:hypothetical protein